MRYYANYSLKISPIEKMIREEFIRKKYQIGIDLYKIINNEEPSEREKKRIAGDPLNYCLYGELKWYESDEDLRKLSERYPGIYFELYYDGEETEDFGYMIAYNGKMANCPAEITYNMNYDAIGLPLDPNEQVYPES